VSNVENDQGLVDVHLEVTACTTETHGHVVRHNLHGDHRERFGLVGFTLPGMIEEPDSFSGITSSANPARAAGH